MHSFTVPAPDLTAALVDLVRQVPKGKVATYGDVASALGDSKAAMWVATTLFDPPPELAAIAHRIVNALGEPGRFPHNAASRLASERVPMHSGRVDVSSARFRDFVGEPPLAQLRFAQEAISDRVRLTPLAIRPDLVAAVDVSYGANNVAVAAYVLMETGSPEPLWTTTATVPVGFPYIQGYLAYRELPVYAKLLQKVIDADRLAPLLLVDGTGILHPRGTGIATQLGVLADHPTVGISKSLLCGKIILDGSFGEGTGRVVHRDETVAAVLPPSRRGKKPIFVSPGHRCTLEDAVAAVLPWRQGLRVPEPIRRADALSRASVKAGLEAS
jgi:deoxyribonuclease V